MKERKEKMDLNCRNAQVPCKDLPQIDLNQWKDRRKAVYVSEELEMKYDHSPRRRKLFGNNLRRKTIQEIWLKYGTVFITLLFLVKKQANQFFRIKYLFHTGL